MPPRVGAGPPPIVYYYAWYWPSYDFGFPFFYDFGYFGYGLTPCWTCSRPAAPAMIVYLTDGSALEVIDYWVQGDTLYYVTESGKHGSVALANVDVQRTTAADARLGFKFNLDRTEPGLPLDPI